MPDGTDPPTQGDLWDLAAAVRELTRAVNGLEEATSLGFANTTLHLEELAPAVNGLEKATSLGFANTLLRLEELTAALPPDRPGPARPPRS